MFYKIEHHLVYVGEDTSEEQSIVGVTGSVLLRKKDLYFILQTSRLNDMFLQEAIQ